MRRETVIREQVNMFSSNEIQRDSQLGVSASCKEDGCMGMLGA
jgi:hypothetical protein